MTNFIPTVFHHSNISLNTNKFIIFTFSPLRKA